MNTTGDYDRIYGKWHSYEPEHIAEMKTHFERFSGGANRLPTDREAPMLDIGCAMGFALIWLRDLGYTAAQGIDRDEGLVAKCREQGLSTSVVEKTAEWLRQRPASFERIFAFDLVEHFPVKQQLELCQAIQTALRPGGQFICTVPNASSVLAGRWRYMCWTHFSSFTEHSLDYLLHLAGFQSIAVEEFELMAPPRSLQGHARHLLLRLFRGLHRLQAATEVGWREARQIPLTLNLRGIGQKPDET